MSTPILATKLYIPPHRPNIVLRPRLIERLNEGLGHNQAFDRKLSLISAPAGFGKTTLVSHWVAGCQQPAAWLSLDEGDNNPTRFLAYLVAALQTVAPTIGKGVLGALQSPQPPPTEPILTALLNDITTVPDPFILVLDDYHVIEAQPVGETLTFLLQHLPPQMHLVIATREDPPLPLARYRARGQLTELRTADLRFTPAEAAGFLNQGMGLNLSAEEIAALETRTEGWIAGLQMAALSMQGRTDTASFIQVFTGSHRFVLDYLVEEILQRQPGRVRRFLLQTSMLDRLSGPLCAAVTRQEDSKGMLETLERSNLFVVPLDDERHWYRYHRLFADVLKARAIEEQPNEVSGLHQRASVWYEQNDLLPDAVRHALSATDFERAAGLIELAWPAMDGSFQSALWLEWVKDLPDDLVRVRPVLSVGYAWALLAGGKMEASEARLRDAERWLDTTADTNEQPEISSAEMVVVDEAQFRSLPASIATARAYRALALADVPGTVKYARQALALLPEGDRQWHGAALSLLGLAQYTSGDLKAADRSLVDFMADMQEASNIPDVISITFILADIRLTLGRLREAIHTYKHSLQLATSQGGPLPLGTADLYRGLSELYCERDDLETAVQHLLTSKKLGEQAALTDWQHRLCVAQARIKEAQGELDDALELLGEAERLYIRTPLPDVRPIAALKTRMWIRQGRLAEALGWVHERGLSIDDDLSYLREFEYVTLARVFIAEYKRDQADGAMRKAMALLERLLQAAEAGGRMGSVIEILVLQAVAHQAQGDTPSAFVPLARALALAEPEGYVRIFVDEGPPIEALLQEAAKHGPATKRGPTLNYVRQLQAALGTAEGKTAVLPPLIEPLSERELNVLKLLGTELSGPEIARELMVSLNTMRTHTKNIYNKLGVNNRRAAVRRAKELDLL